MEHAIGKVLAVNVSEKRGEINTMLTKHVGDPVEILEKAR